MSFVHVENVRFDNQNVITDINLRNESGKITTNTSYQKRQMPKGDIDSTEKTFHSESIEATIKLWMDYIDSSYVCQGFLVKDTDNVYGDPVSKHSITYTEDGIKETEMRGFSSHCEVLSNSEGNAVPCAAKLKIIWEENTFVWKNTRIDPYSTEMQPQVHVKGAAPLLSGKSTETGNSRE